ncbi:MAG TPA: D-alanyl-D-alanine carboxypeptidase family protein [Candidatus Absconditabacterales bacterium]|nr:D-alanyl-D-alanine carboxypeptidase family protein [Candidatus Absconditabacterales bacterium]
MSRIRRAIKSGTNIIIGFCVFVFIFLLRQNFAKADVSIKKPAYDSSSMSEFISQKSIALLQYSLSNAQQQYRNNFDLNSDYSLQKYLSDQNILQNKNYEPSDLVQIDSEYIVNRAGRPYLRQAAQVAFEKMAFDFYQELDQQFYLISAYRTSRDQATMFEGGCSSIRCAKIGGSEHQLGLAVDIHVATKNGYNIFGEETFERMNKNAYKYGYINTYRKGADVDGKMKEVRHWRYVGIPLATELYKKDMSFVEYYNKLVKSEELKVNS